uniref:Ig-like domain-containing protein n=1 Tax=Denticeps clupeoides TaxID=299321 RepID=A0AAY4BQ44_9TELE
KGGSTSPYSLVFCSEFVSNKVHYSPGDRVVLPCALKDVSRAVITQWFYQPSPDREVLIADSGDKPAVTSEFKDRAKLSKDFSLTLSKLASQDNGTYWCVVLEDDDEDNYDYDGSATTTLAKVMHGTSNQDVHCKYSENDKHQDWLD